MILERSAVKFPVCILLAAALGGSAWAALGAGGCHACRQTSSLVGGTYLAWTGVAAYLPILLITLFRGLIRPVVLILWTAAGVHLSLMGFLLAQRIVCPPCLVVGVSVLLAAFWTLRDKKTPLRTVSLLLMGGTITGAVVVATAVRVTALARQRAVIEAARSVLATRIRPAPGHVDMIVLTRKGCPHCAALRTAPSRPSKVFSATTYRLLKWTPERGSHADVDRCQAVVITFWWGFTTPMRSGV